jgi:iron complex outermembrane receptor protein
MQRFHGARSSLLTAVAVSALAMASPLQAQDRPRQDYSLETQDLADALRAVSRQSGQEIMFSEEAVSGKRAPRLNGPFTVEEAVRALIAGTNLIATFSADGILIRGRSETPGEVADRSVDGSDIIVTGSHIRGVASSSPVIVATRRAIENSGQFELGAFIRTIPQNFTGGQNPTVFAGSSPNENTTNSSAFNLRGLGPDATLTLINGHRVAYDGISQGVDISAIPLAAIEQIEIVPDGSSALYGSDAVGGVANVRLRRDFDGAVVTARFGASTDGGNEQQQYSAVTGARWAGGGFMLAGDYTRVTPIVAGQRSYTQTLSRSQPIVPGQKQTSFVLAAHQQLSDRVHLSIDAELNDRRSPNGYANAATTDYLTDGQAIQRDLFAYTISPSIAVDLSHDWSASATASYGVSRTKILNRAFFNGLEAQRTNLRYNNTLASVELGLEGALLALPAGELRLAAGGGYRSTGLSLLNRVTSGGSTRIAGDYDKNRDVAFGYAELSLPVVSAINHFSVVEKLSFSAAARYEKYRDGEGVVTPKLGITYSPIGGVTLQGSWGKSYKAQTLDQEFQVRDVSLLGGGLVLDLPANRTFLYLSGGGDALAPERATTWSTTLALEPALVRGLKVEISYYGVRFRDRVTTPLSSLANATRDPSNLDLLTLNPSPAEQARLIATSTFGLRNFCGCAYDPAAVGLVINNRFQNAANQTVEGVDLSVDYLRELDHDTSITLTGTASYITSEQQRIDGVPYVPLAGTIFDPPHWRGRIGTTYQQSNLTYSIFGNYIGGVTDNRQAPAYDTGAFFSLDSAVRVRSTSKSGFFAGLEGVVSAQNLLNRKPDTLRNSSPIDPTYDTTNYSPIGRVISISVSKAF